MKDSSMPTSFVAIGLAVVRLHDGIQRAGIYPISENSIINLVE